MGVVFDIQKCCLHDGPGIRTTVFLKGCNLRCQWCHNPESFRASPELFFQESLCTACGACVSACPRQVHAVDAAGIHGLNRAACKACGLCVDVCPQDALRIYGCEMSAQQVFEEVRKDTRFYTASGGGVTMSGGEAALQAGFTMEILSLCKAEGFHTALETNGNLSWETLEALLPLVDLFLYDIKHTDSAEHRRLTGAGNELILQNLRSLKARGAVIWLRCPVIPTVNDTDAHFDALRELIREVRPQRWEVMAYHDTGKGKWHGLGLDYALETLPTAASDAKSRWEEELASGLGQSR